MIVYASLQRWVVCELKVTIGHPIKTINMK
jgi:hypothetical protein